MQISGNERITRHIIVESFYRGDVMAMRDNLTKKLSQATVDKIELNRQVLKLKKSFDEAEKALNAGKRKKEK